MYVYIYINNNNNNNNSFYLYSAPFNESQRGVANIIAKMNTVICSIRRS